MTLIGARLIIISVVTAIAVFAWYPVTVTPASSDVLSVRFLDVGQGDAIHIVTPDGHELLIDGGPDTSVLREFAVGRSVFDRHIDMVIATHPDADHIGGLVDVLERYEVSWILVTDNENDTPVAARFKDVVAAEGAEYVRAQRGQMFTLGASTTIEILSPYGVTTNWQSNASSIILRVSYGEIDFLLTGDALAMTELTLVELYGEQLESEVLKLGHHGSDTSSAAGFLNTVAPTYAVVSAGADNRYGHPHREVVDRVNERGIKIVSTAGSGTIEFQTDGTRLWLQD